MKKFVSIFMALAMISSLFITSVSADVTTPASVTVTANAHVATQAEIDAYLVAKSKASVAAGYTLYGLTISQTGFGTIQNTSSDATCPTGLLPAQMTFKLSFGTDYSKIASRGNWWVKSQYAYTTSVGGNAATFNYGTYAEYDQPYPVSTPIAEGGEIVTIYLPLSDEATFDLEATFVMSYYEDGEPATLDNGNIRKEYSDGQSNVSYSPSSSLAFAAPTTNYTVTFMNGSSQVSTKSDYESGDALVVPSDPTPAAGYTFAGWALGSADNAVSDLTGATVSADATYYAKFTPIVPSAVTISGATAGTVGTPVVLTAATTPAVVANPTVTWTYVGGTATGGAVSNGSVSATGAGTVIVKATVDSVASADYTVTFTVPVTGITLNKASATLTVGDTETLVATIAPPAATNQAVDWSSSDNNVATVDSNGVVTAIAKGTATITAETADGGFTDTCTVTVEEAAPPLPGDIAIKPGAIIKEYLSGSEHATLKPGQKATVETDANYYVTEFDTNALNFAAYDYAVVAYEEGSEVPHVFDKINGENLREAAGRLDFFVIIKKVTNKDKPITNIVVRAFEQE